SQPVASVSTAPPAAEPVPQPTHQPSFSVPVPQPTRQPSFSEPVPPSVVAEPVAVPPIAPPTPPEPAPAAAASVVKPEKPEPPKKPTAKNTAPPKPGPMPIDPIPAGDVAAAIAQESSSPAKTAPRRDPIPVDLMTLPVLRESDKERLGLGDIRINMVRPANRAHPYASAIINLQPVHIGERIPDTSAVLIGVDTRSVAIEIENTGERFHIRF
ncbi:MAG TPA: hypothetical protein PKO36_15750, partial [Candidatus Hydrogenedentes bacterium]|nr:hypothetical protein [Candidatus Hydrogenedentota bacterium]